MKKQIMTIVLIAMSIGATFAQSNTSDKIALGNTMKVDYKDLVTRHRHIIYLEKGNQVRVELNSLGDYNRLKDIKAILQRVQKNTSFYADTALENNEHLLINYSTSVPPGNDKMRFRRVEDGDVFINYKGETRRLKMAQDTIEITVYDVSIANDIREREFSLNSGGPVYVSLILNNYTDIQGIIDESDILQQCIDTLPKAVTANGKETWTYATTAYCYAPSPGKPLRLQHFKTLASEDRAPYFDKHHDRVSLLGNIGAGLVRNKLSPFAEVGLEYRDYFVNGKEDYSTTGLYISPYFLFNQGADGKYRTYTNWFINAEIGSFFDKNNDMMGLYLKRMTLGGGYLLNPDKIHFQRTTFKLFMNYQLPKGITITPEVIFTNNLKNIFPGITIKVF